MAVKKTTKLKSGRPATSIRTKTQVLKLRKELTSMILDKDMSWKEFVGYCKKEHGISNSYATEIWNELWKDIDKLVQKHHLIKSQTLINRLVEMSNDTNSNVALKAIEQLRKMGGLDENEKLDITHKGRIDITWGK